MHGLRSLRRLPRRRQGGFTLLEAMVAISVVALIGILIYGVFNGMSKSRNAVKQVSDRYQQGRQAMQRMSVELSSAFLSGHMPINPIATTRQTAFIGSDSAGGDRVDFTAFANRRLARDAHESDQAEISYFLADNPNGGRDLVRRIDKYIDEDPEHGGLVQVVAERVADGSDAFEVRYLDPLTNEWVESWDSTQAAAQFGRLPSQVWIRLKLESDIPNQPPIVFSTKTALPINLPITFAIN